MTKRKEFKREAVGLTRQPNAIVSQASRRLIRTITSFN